MDPKKLVAKESDLDVSESSDIDELNEELEDLADDDLLLGGCRGRHCYTTIDKL